MAGRCLVILNRRTKFLRTVRAPGRLVVESSLKPISDSSSLIEWLGRLTGLAPENRVVRWNPEAAETSSGTREPSSRVDRLA